jgi:serine/threonine protein kinase
VTPFDPPLTPAEIHVAFPGRFAQLSALKSGGQGSVFRGSLGHGQGLSPGTELALKIYYADNVVERAEREIAALERIKADSLVRLVGTGHLDIRGFPCVWLETEFIEGEPLSARIARGPLDVVDIATMARDIALAIEAIWADRIVHRDIKPDNIMLRPTGRAVLIDLGVARHTALSSLTTLGKTWGTEGYLSPEQAQTKRALTCKSDVFALGIVAQEALLGRHPTQRRQGLLAMGGASTAALRDGLPAGLVALIDLMVHREPLLRPLPGAVASGFQSMLAP